MIFLLLLLSFTDLSPPLGALPEFWEKYKNSINFDDNTFRCFDGLKTIDLSKVNDNYKDCDDGSDEPGTSAHNNGKFYCRNNGSVPIIINKWSVNDGICDCCDGSDEIHNDYIKCPNICPAVEDQRQQIILFLDDIYKKGLEIAEALEKVGFASYEANISKKNSIDAEIKELEEQKKVMVEEAEHQLNEKENKETHEDNDNIIENGDSNMENHNNINENDLESDIKYDNDDNKENDIIHNINEDGNNEENNFNFETDESNTNENSNINQNDDNNDDDEPENNDDNEQENDDDNIDNEQEIYDRPNFNEEDFKKNPVYGEEGDNDPLYDLYGYGYDPYDHYGYDSYNNANNEPFYKTIEVEEECEYDFGELSPIQEFFLKLWKLIFHVNHNKKHTRKVTKEVENERFYDNYEVNYDYDRDRYHHHYDYDNSYNYGYETRFDEETNQKINDLQTKIDDLQNDLSTIDKFLKFENISKGYLTMIENKYELDDFKFDFLNEITKSYDNIGRFQSFDGNVIKMGDGDYCWQESSSKRTEIYPICYNESKLIRVIEASPCSYKAWFGTPSACSSDDIEKIKSLSLEELQNLKNQLVVN